MDGSLEDYIETKGNLPKKREGQMAEENMVQQEETVSGLPQEEAIGIMKKIVKSYESMHQSNFIHIDLKPANILCKKNKNGEY